MNQNVFSWNASSYPQDATTDKNVGDDFYEPVTEALKLREKGVISVEHESMVFVDECGEVCSVADYIDGSD